ncbi:MAG TPA: hypothetical protein VHF47_13950, partial [Acidimicrobiales bacterium]|nr:hypothetical protein [Acidimicrobiales bacterium]
KADVEALRAELKGDLHDSRVETISLRGQVDALAERMQSTADQVRTEFHRDMRVHTLVLVGTIVTLNGMLASAARIF